MQEDLQEMLEPWLMRWEIDQEVNPGPSQLRPLSIKIWPGQEWATVSCAACDAVVWAHKYEPGLADAVMHTWNPDPSGLIFWIASKKAGLHRALSEAPAKLLGRIRVEKTKQSARREQWDGLPRLASYEVWVSISSGHLQDLEEIRWTLARCITEASEGRQTGVRFSWAQEDDVRPLAWGHRVDLNNRTPAEYFICNGNQRPEGVSENPVEQQRGHTWEVYSDGSLTNGMCGVGVAYKEDEQWQMLRWKLPVDTPIVVAESYGMLRGLRRRPAAEEHVTAMVDSAAALYGFKTFLRAPELYAWDQREPIYRELAELIEQSEVEVTFHKIKAHFDAYLNGRNVNEGNKQADQAAKAAAIGEDEPVDLPDGRDGGVFSLRHQLVPEGRPAGGEWKVLSTRHGRQKVYETIVAKWQSSENSKAKAKRMLQAVSQCDGRSLCRFKAAWLPN